MLNFSTQETLSSPVVRPAMFNFKLHTFSAGAGAAGSGVTAGAGWLTLDGSSTTFIVMATSPPAIIMLLFTKTNSPVYELYLLGDCNANLNVPVSPGATDVFCNLAGKYGSGQNLCLKVSAVLSDFK